MADERPRFLARWASLPLRTHVLMACLTALAVLTVSLRKRALGEAAPGAAGTLPKPAVAAAFPTRLSPDRMTETEASREAQPISPGYRRDVVRPLPVQSAAPEALSPPVNSTTPSAGLPAGMFQNRRRDERKPLPELFRMPPDPRPDPAAMRRIDAASKEAPGGLKGAFAPFGRLVKCTLVNSLDSATGRAEPIVALVVRDVDWNGAVIIPAGTEAFSYARPGPILDAKNTGRLIDSGEWILVFPESDDRPNGRELVLKGRALDRRETSLADDGRVRTWGVDDGTDGLVGRAISTLDDREIKLFAAAAISGVAQGFEALAERQQAAAGLAGVLGSTQAAPTAANAAIGSAGQGAVGVMNELASRIRQEISQRGVYVRVPAGKEFYLFVEQTIDPGAAAVGLHLPNR